jgi:hypothetical protein
MLPQLSIESQGMYTSIQRIYTNALPIQSLLRTLGLIALNGVYSGIQPSGEARLSQVLSTQIRVHLASQGGGVAPQFKIARDELER